MICAKIIFISIPKHVNFPIYFLEVDTCQISTLNWGMRWEVWIYIHLSLSLSITIYLSLFLSLSLSLMLFIAGIPHQIFLTDF